MDRFTREGAMLGGRMEKPDDRWSRIADFLRFTCSWFLDGLSKKKMDFFVISVLHRGPSGKKGTTALVTVTF